MGVLEPHVYWEYMSICSTAVERPVQFSSPQGWEHLNVLLPFQPKLHLIWYRGDRSSRPRFFSRSFMKWNANMIVTFFNPHELSKIDLKSSTKLYGVKLNHLGWGTDHKGCSFFQRNIQYRARLKSPSSSFFRKKYFQRVPSIFLMFCDRMVIEKSERVPFSARQGPVLTGNARASSVVWVFRKCLETFL